MITFYIIMGSLLAIYLWSEKSWHDCCKESGEFPPVESYWALCRTCGEDYPRHELECRMCAEWSNDPARYFHMTKVLPFSHVEAMMEALHIADLPVSYDLEAGIASCRHPKTRKQIWGAIEKTNGYWIVLHDDDLFATTMTVES